MPVKDLVKRFESTSQSPEPSPPVRRQSALRSQSRDDSARNSTNTTQLTSPARFVHPLLKLRANSVEVQQNGKQSESSNSGGDGTNVVKDPSDSRHFVQSKKALRDVLRQTKEDGTGMGASGEPLGSGSMGQGGTKSVALVEPRPLKDVTTKSIVASEDVQAEVTGEERRGAQRSQSSLRSIPRTVDGLPLTSSISTVRPHHLPIQQNRVSTTIPPPTPGVSVSRIQMHSETPSSPPAYSISTLIGSKSPQSLLSNDDIKLDTFIKRPYDSYDTHDNYDIKHPASSTVIHTPPSLHPHVPIAAKTVFSRGAAPLSLPALDDHLSTFPAPKFSSFPSHVPPKGKKDKQSTPFPPMELLASTGRTIEDLEKNSTVRSWFFNRGSIFNSLTNWTLGLLGSSALVSYYSLHGLYDSLQIFALLLSIFVKHDDETTSNLRKLFLGTIPNVLALNFGRTLVSLIMFVIFMALSGVLLYYFHVSVTDVRAAQFKEGFQGKDTRSRWGVVFTAFILTLIYLPMSTIAVHALVWSSDFWPGPVESQITVNVCYTTTLNQNEINWAPLVVVLAALTFIFLTIGFPIRLAIAIRSATPRVDKFTELGRLRNKVETHHEYQRLLDRDDNPLSFLYKDLRIGWATYKSAYLFVKLSTLLVVALLDTSNCMLLNANPYTVSMVRQALLVVAMTAFLGVQSFLTPFLDPVSNASEWVSRIGYVAFAVIGLIATTNSPDNVKAAFNGPILYVVYVINYGFSFYFAFINLSWTHRLVKKLSRRLDFSIDIFSPRLDISSRSRHIKRRVWQETISVVLLATPECAMPKDQKLVFAEAENSQWPPYLLDFRRTPAERHVENLKILRELGGTEYATGVALWNSKHCDRMKDIQDHIQRNFIGPDSYWQPPQRYPGGECFGNAWWIPFPPTLVMRYDTGEITTLKRLSEFEMYIRQNEDRWVQDKRRIRMALRSLDGKVVRWPYTHTQWVGSKFPWCWGHRYSAQITMKYESCVFSIKRKGTLPWKGYQLGSGFEIQLRYTPEVQVDGTVIGVDVEFDMTPQLAHFLKLNRNLIHEYLPQIEYVFHDYRRWVRRSTKAKRDVLTYEFLSNVYCSPKAPHELNKTLSEQEKDLRVRQAFVEAEDAISAANERMAFVSQSEVSTWWYLYWDDLWRRNHDVVDGLQKHARDFDPHYPTSIAYRLLPRAALENFLTQRGLFSGNNGKKKDFIHTGVLNKLYFRLNQIVFRGSSKVIQYHLGEASYEIDLEGLSELAGHTRTSTLGTGGGTDHDDEEIRARPAYRWEDIFEDPISHERGRRWFPKLKVWLGLSPYWHSQKARTTGVSLDLRLEDGSYVMLDKEVNRLKQDVV